MNVKKRTILMNAMLTCIYAVLTFICAPFSYGAIQFRLAEILMFLAFYNRRFIPGLVIGCLLANAFSPMGIYDVIFGTSATLLTCLSFTRIPHLWMGVCLGALFNGIIVGAELYFLFNLPFLLNAGYVFIGEAIVLIIGAGVFKVLEKNQVFMKIYMN